MKKLLIFIISLNLYQLISADEIYTIKSGDTISSIAKNKNLSIYDIFNANSEIGLNPDFISIGQNIYLPILKKDIYVDKCSRYGVHINQSILLNEDLTTRDCITFIEENTDLSILKNNYENEDFWESFSKDPGYSYWLINSFGLIADPYSTWAEAMQDELVIRIFDILFEAAKRGYELPTLFFIHAGVYFDKEKREELKTSNKIFAAYEESDKEQIIDFCKNNLRTLLEINLQELKADFFEHCAGELWEVNDSYHEVYDQKLYEIYINLETSYVSTHNMLHVTNVAYRFINSNREKDALYVVEKYIEDICRTCKKITKYTTPVPSAYFYNALIDYSNENQYKLSYYFFSIGFYLDLNYTSAFYALKSLDTDRLLSDRSHMIKLINDDIRIYNDKPDIVQEVKDLRTATNSDTALKLLQRGQCSKSKEFLDSALDDYININLEDFTLVRDDIFTEPLIMLDCFLDRSLDIDYQYYFDYVEDAEERYSYFSILNDIFKDSLKLKINKNKSNKEVIATELIKLIDRSEKYITTSLNSREIENFEIVILNLFDVAIYIDQKDIYEKILNIVYIKNSFEYKKDFAYKNESKAYPKAEIDKNNNDINVLQNKKDITEEDYLKILELTSKNNSLLKDFLESKDSTDSYFNNSITVKKLRSKLKNDDFIIQFIFDNNNSGVVSLISMNSTKIFKIDERFGVENDIEKLNNSLQDITSFDFRTANLLYKKLFQMVLSDVPKESNVYILSGDINSIVPNILVSNYSEDKNISLQEQIIKAKWLIEDYKFISLEYLEKSRKKIAFSEPFLGYGNSSTYKWVGLPNLVEAEQEILNLAISSNASRDNVLIKNLATKENFIKRLKNPTKRIVISTHAVPDNWLGLTSEPSLIFNSYKGDIFLTPSEIIDMEIDTEMLILSSCNSNTNGFNKLPKAFLVAGANTIVYTNWNLESKFATEFTSAFVKNLWFYQESNHKSLRETALNYLNDFSNAKFSHPSFWGNYSIVYSSID